MFFVYSEKQNLYSGSCHAKNETTATFPKKMHYFLDDIFRENNARERNSNYHPSPPLPNFTPPFQSPISQYYSSKSSIN